MTPAKTANLAIFARVRGPEKAYTIIACGPYTPHFRTVETRFGIDVKQRRHALTARCQRNVLTRRHSVAVRGALAVAAARARFIAYTRVHSDVDEVFLADDAPGRFVLAARFAAGRGASSDFACAAPSGSGSGASSGSRSLGSIPAPASDAPVAVVAGGCAIANCAIWLNCACSRFHQPDASNAGDAVDSPASPASGALAAGGGSCRGGASGAGCVIDCCANAPNARSVASVARCTSSAW